LRNALDLDGNTLSVAGSWLQNTYGQSDTFTVENGTLKLGTDSVVGTVSLASNQGTSVLQLRNGGKLDTYNVTTISIGEWGEQQRQLDLSCVRAVVVDVCREHLAAVFSTILALALAFFFLRQESGVIRICPHAILN